MRIWWGANDSNVIFTNEVAEMKTIGLNVRKAQLRDANDDRTSNKESEETAMNLISAQKHLMLFVEHNVYIWVGEENGQKGRKSARCTHPHARLERCSASSTSPPKFSQSVLVCRGIVSPSQFGLVVRTPSSVHMHLPTA